MRISDWSSDVCSSDLPILWDFGTAVRHHKLYSPWLPQENRRAGFLGVRGAVATDAGLMRDAVTEIKRSEESRVGTGGVSTCRARGARKHEKKNKVIIRDKEMS